MPLPSLRRKRIMPKSYPLNKRARVVKMVLDHLDEYRSASAACQSIGPRVGVGVESMGRRKVQVQIDVRRAPGPTSEEQRIRDLEREVRGRKEASNFSGCLTSL